MSTPTSIPLPPPVLPTPGPLPAPHLRPRTLHGLAATLQALLILQAVAGVVAARPLLRMRSLLEPFPAGGEFHFEDPPGYVVAAITLTLVGYVLGAAILVVGALLALRVWRNNRVWPGPPVRVSVLTRTVGLVAVAALVGVDVLALASPSDTAGDEILWSFIAFAGHAATAGPIIVLTRQLNAEHGRRIQADFSRELAQRGGSFYRHHP